MNFDDEDNPPLRWRPARAGELGVLGVETIDHPDYSTLVSIPRYPLVLQWQNAKSGEWHNVKERLP